MPEILFHVSEDPNIEMFRPHHAKGREHEPPCVWAVDAEHAPLYWFPRDRPRVTFWADENTPPEDRERSLSFGSAARMHVTENAWLGRMRSVKLYVYRFAPEPFALHPEPGGFYVLHREVVPERCEPVGDLLARHADAGIELRFTPSLWPLQRAVAASSLPFSTVRPKNALPEP